ncbi:MAG: nicotinate phosphoribosyltransferase [Candidatus Thermoplasmatota archaeon]|nr:nicotinate phosphoribosyltransferase [Candidatus Thermoplasmatota archaeon]
MDKNLGFHLVGEEEIKKGKTTDIYFENTMDIFEQKGVGDENVVAEFTASSFPSDWSWAVFCGLDEVLHLLEGKDIDIYSLKEGTIFRSEGRDGVFTPVLWIEGPYKEFCIYETPILGFVCHPTGVATKSARVNKVAGDSTVMSFGIRRMHPGIATVIDRSAYIGGCDGISCIAGAQEVGIEPQGTMPHALTIIFDDPKKAFEAFDEALPEDVPRIALVDTYYDEKKETMMAVEAMGENLYGVRLDTPSSRRGDLGKIAEEVIWELERKGVETKIICSGGIDEYYIPKLKEAGADSFGVGTSISNARTVNFAMDIVEKEGDMVAKRGKFSGKKQAYRCPKCFTYDIRAWDEKEKPECDCGSEMEPMLEKVMEDGEIIVDYPEASEIRDYVLDQLSKVEADWLE